MKKTITTLTLAVSATSAYALVGTLPPGSPPAPRNPICLAESYVESDRSVRVENCDKAEENQRYGRQLQDNGCAEGQVSLARVRSVRVPACRTMVQL